MKYDIITELKNKVYIDKKCVLERFSRTQINDLKFLLSCFKFGPNSVSVGKEEKDISRGTISFKEDYLDYEANTNGSEPFFIITNEPSLDEIQTSIKFMYNHEILKVIKKVESGIIIIESDNTLFKTGFQPVSIVPVIIKYFDNAALEQLRTGNYITHDMDLELAKKGIIPDKEIKLEITRDEFMDWSYNLFGKPLEAYNELMKYINDNNLFSIEHGEKTK